METKDPQARIAYLDALRGIAILWVMLFHAYSKWVTLYPYGDRFRNAFFVSAGTIGVDLFFIISGFVILMTLEKCRGLGEFLGRRWLRLFPAMLICSLWVYATLGLFAGRPGGTQVPLRCLLPGVTFVGPEWWSYLLHQRVFNLEEPFWSLYIEVKFYVVFALLYFILGTRKAIAGLALIFLGAVLFQDFPWVFGAQRGSAWASFGWNVTYLTDGKTFGWFAAGAMFYRFNRSRERGWMYAGLGAAVLASFFNGDLRDFATKRWDLLVVLLFVLPLVSRRTAECLSRRVLVFLGFISYPLYLIHEGMMVSLIGRMGRLAPGLPAFLLPLVPMGVCALAAWLVARYAEPGLRGYLRVLFRGDRRVPGIRRETSQETAPTSEEEHEKN